MSTVEYPRAGAGDAPGNWHRKASSAVDHHRSSRRFLFPPPVHPSPGRPRPRCESIGAVGLCFCVHPWTRPRWTLPRV